LLETANDQLADVSITMTFSGGCMIVKAKPKPLLTFGDSVLTLCLSRPSLPLSAKVRKQDVLCSHHPRANVLDGPDFYLGLAPTPIVTKTILRGVAFQPKKPKTFTKNQWAFRAAPPKGDCAIQKIRFTNLSCGPAGIAADA
jgi:hypothetical protein